MSPDTRQAIQQIRSLWDTGGKATLPDPKDPGYELARNARRFHECYSREELTELLDLLAKHQRAWGYSHVWKLVSIEDKRLRKQIQRLAIKEDWKRAQLRREIIASRGRVRHGGRRHKIPESDHELMVQLDSLCQSWARLSDNMDAVETALPPAAARQFKVATEDIKILQQKLARALDAIYS